MELDPGGFVDEKHHLHHCFGDRDEDTVNNEENDGI